MKKFEGVSDEGVIAHVEGSFGDERLAVARNIEGLLEIDERRLHLKLACSSLWDFCVRRGRMSENEAALRIAVVRVAQKFPVVLGLLERGDLHMTACGRVRLRGAPFSCERTRKKHHLEREPHAVGDGASSSNSLASTARVTPHTHVRSSSI